MVQENFSIIYEHCWLISLHQNYAGYFLLPKVQGVYFTFAARQLYNKGNLQSPGHSVTTAVPSTVIKETNCILDTITSRYLTVQLSSRDCHYSCNFVRILPPSRLVLKVWSQNGTFQRPAIISNIFQIIDGVIYYFNKPHKK